MSVSRYQGSVATTPSTMASGDSDFSSSNEQGTIVNDHSADRVVGAEANEKRYLYVPGYVRVSFSACLVYLFY